MLHCDQIAASSGISQSPGLEPGRSPPAFRALASETINTLGQNFSARSVTNPTICIVESSSVLGRILIADRIPGRAQSEHDREVGKRHAVSVTSFGNLSPAFLRCAEIAARTKLYLRSRPMPGELYPRHGLIPHVTRYLEHHNILVQMTPLAGNGLKNDSVRFRKAPMECRRRPPGMLARVLRGSSEGKRTSRCCRINT